MPTVEDSFDLYQNSRHFLEGIGKSISMLVEKSHCCFNASLPYTPKMGSPSWYTLPFHLVGGEMFGYLLSVLL